MKTVSPWTRKMSWWLPAKFSALTSSIWSSIRMLASLCKFATRCLGTSSYLNWTRQSFIKTRCRSCPRRGRKSMLSTSSKKSKSHRKRASRSWTPKYTDRWLSCASITILTWPASAWPSFIGYWTSRSIASANSTRSCSFANPAAWCWPSS